MKATKNDRVGICDIVFRDGAWAVIDTETREVVIANDKPQDGLSFDEADAVADCLNLLPQTPARTC